LHKGEQLKNQETQETMTKTTILSPLLSSLLLLGCAGIDDASPSGDKADEVAAADARSGSFVTQMITQQDGCGLDEALHEPELVEVTASDDGNHFEYEEDGNLISCDRNATGSYDCTLVSEATELLSAEVTMDATWTDADRFEGTLAMKMDCSEEMSPDFCRSLAESLPNGLPCEVSAKVIATPPMADDFAPELGTYSLAVGEALPVSSCAQAFPVTPEQNALLEESDQDREFKLFDDDGGALAPFDCFSGGEGVIECERSLELQGLSIQSQIITVFSGAGATEGALEVALDCVSDDQAVCDDLSQTFGELPCRSIQPVSAKVQSDSSSN
jgi:hypothetical protein